MINFKNRVTVAAVLQKWTLSFLRFDFYMLNGDLEVAKMPVFFPYNCCIFRNQTPSSFRLDAA